MTSQFDISNSPAAGASLRDGVSRERYNALAATRRAQVGHACARRDSQTILQWFAQRAAVSTAALRRSGALLGYARKFKAESRVEGLRRLQDLMVCRTSELGAREAGTLQLSAQVRCHRRAAVRGSSRGAKMATRAVRSASSCPRSSRRTWLDRNVSSTMSPSVDQGEVSDAPRDAPRVNKAAPLHTKSFTKRSDSVRSPDGKRVRARKTIGDSRSRPWR